MSKFYFIYLFWVKRVARLMPKANKFVRKMSNDTKITLKKMKKMLGDVGNAKKKLDNVKRVLGTPTKG
jgi:hypothetical protein